MPFLSTHLKQLVLREKLCDPNEAQIEESLAELNPVPVKELDKIQFSVNDISEAIKELDLFLLDTWSSWFYGKSYVTQMKPKSRKALLDWTLYQLRNSIECNSQLTISQKPSSNWTCIRKPLMVISLLGSWSNANIERHCPNPYF